ncbi:LysR family transcriptional regulator [Acinetobacter sp. GFQ9D192M]|uniref:LysR family transcriptional regulator n=1 Tax=Acinetobacter variabilis TaxID=70346 RepID=A0A7T7WGS2_9GAMM|nr:MULTISPECIES: LysR substrate-binding domain-containing protein [Acinetobacter]NHB67006.1 LysR family transcriptional regulator [Acinetobacter sp. GFQ9D191M]NHC02136.1 LysR family transcriptional regulator [Acinetobacter sp. GFQ9D192M]QQN87287.1 LysR family transcriptional regulator [Acinetobacter variabilis]
MELRHLRYFITVAQEQSFTRAAEKLFTAQPSLSQQIKDLEQEVGVNLFERSSRKIHLTDEGKAFLIYAEKALENAKLAVASARQVAQQKNNQIHIGFLNVAELKVMPHILAKLKKTMPDLKIHLHSLFCLEQLQRLKNAELDLSITRFQLDHPDFDNIHLLTEQIHLVAAKHLHPTDRILKLQELKNHTIIMCDQNASPVFYERLNALMSFDQLKHDQVLWATNVLQHINLINMGMGFSFAPDYLLRFLNDEVKVIQTDRPLPQVELYATFNKNSQNPALNIITEALNNTVNA